MSSLYGYEEDSASGIRLDDVIGIEWNRASETRWSVETGLALPLYSVGDSYPASFNLMLGFAR